MPDATVDFIATVHPYDSLKRDELARVAGSFSRRSFAAGDVIYEFGDRLPGLYLIETGRVAVTDRNGDSVSQLGPRNSFGERGLLRDGVAVTSARVIEPAVILMLPRAEVIRLIAEHRAVGRFFDRGRGPVDQICQIAQPSELGEGRILFEPLHQNGRLGQHALADMVLDGVEQPVVERLVEMRSAQPVRQPFEHGVVEHQRAQQRLLGLQVVRQGRH